jgi:hypothetical protein
VTGETERSRTHHRLFVSPAPRRISQARLAQFVFRCKQVDVVAEKMQKTLNIGGATALPFWSIVLIPPVADF